MEALTKYEFSFKNLFVPLTNAKAIILIIIVGFVVYGNALFNGFVWDDKILFAGLQEPYSLNLFRTFLPNLFNASGYYRPFSMLYFYILHSFFHEIPFFFHLLQVFLHISITSIIFIIFKGFFKTHIALFLSLVFLVHPINVESVAYIGATQNQLLSLFGLIALLLSQKTLNKTRLLVIGCLLLLALLTKEIGILYFILATFLLFMFNKNSAIPMIITQCIALVIYLCTRFFIAGIFLEKLTYIPIGKLNLTERLINIPKILYYYFSTFFFPKDLAVNQQWVVTTTTPNNFFIPLYINIIIFVLLLALGFYIYRFRTNVYKPYVFFLIWLVIGLAFISQLFPLDMTVADRWFYFPIIGLLGVLGIVLELLFVRLNQIKSFLIIILIVILVALSFRTIVRNTNFKDNITLFSHDSLIHTNRSTEHNLGVEYILRHNYDKAISHLHKSIEIQPCDNTYFNLGDAYEAKNEMHLAMAQYAKALNAPTCKPISRKHDLLIYLRSGRLLLLNNLPDQARKYLLLGLIDYPNNGFLWTFLSMSEYKLGNYDQAIIAAEKGNEITRHKFSEYILQQIKRKNPIDLNYLSGVTR